MKKKKITEYEAQLKDLIKDRTGMECEKWMDLPIHTAAMCLVMIDKMQEELEKDSPFVTLETGSTGQAKVVMTPLVAAYKDMQRTMIMHYENLGLSYKNDPGRIASSAKKENETDGAQAFINSVNDGQ